MIGFICINKRVGDSSTYCVNKAKRKLKCKCGHMGTLDPLASGVLPIGLGQATRLFDILMDKRKTYIATFDFAYETPSLDLETQPVNFSQVIPTKTEIEKVLNGFIGDIMQIPPKYSAKFIDGKRSYKLARQGLDVDLKPKKVRVYDLKLLEQLTNSEFKFEIQCGGGTYIRSLVRDMALALGCFGTMTSLTRTKSGFFKIENSVGIDEFISDDDPTKYIIKPQDVLDFDTVVLSQVQAKRLIDGLYDEYALKDGLYKVFNGEEFWGVGEVRSNILKMKVYVRDL